MVRSLFLVAGLLLVASIVWVVVTEATTMRRPDRAAAMMRGW